MSSHREHEHSHIVTLQLEYNSKVKSRPDRSFVHAKMRRPKGGGRRSKEVIGLPKFSWRLASMLLLEISPNFVVQAAPNEKQKYPFRGILIFRMEQVRGVEPLSTAWKAVVIAIIRHLLGVLRSDERSVNHSQHILRRNAALIKSFLQIILNIYPNRI